MKIPLPRNRAVRYGLYLFFAFFTFFIFLQILRWNAYRRSAREFQEIADRLDAEDAGWDWDSIQKNLKPISNEENSYTIIAKLLAMPISGRGSDPNPNDWYILPEPMPWEVADFAGEFVGDRWQAIQLALTLEHKPYGRHPIKYSEDFIGTNLPTIQHTRTIANLLQWDLRVNAQFGRFDECIRDIRATRNAARSVAGEEGFMIPFLVRVAIDAVATKNVQYMLSQGVAPETGLALIQKELLEESREPLFYLSLRGERAIWLKAMQYFGQQNNGRNLGQFKSSLGAPVRKSKIDELDDHLTSYRYLPYAKADQANLLLKMTEFIEYTNLPDFECWKKFHDIDPPNLHQFANRFEVKTLLSRYLLPAVSNVVKADSRLKAELRSAATGIAVERFRMSHQRWPKTLDELVPKYMEKVEIDPFTGAPLLYKQLSDGVVMYSVGEDMKDNGGEVMDKISRDGYERGNYRSLPATDRGIRLWNPELRGK